MKQAKKLYQRRKAAEKATQFRTPFGMLTSVVKQQVCAHDWAPDGQTMAAVRVTCRKCGKTELRA